MLRLIVFTFRWFYITNTLKTAGIECLGFSSDADGRLLKAMKIIVGLGLQNDEQIQKWQSIYFSCLLEVPFLVMQDWMHILSKLRTRLVDSSHPMCIGNFMISIGSLRVSLKLC